MIISFVIPAYNEAGNIGSLLTQVIESPFFDAKNVNYDIIVVDDASEDATYDEVVGFDNPSIKVLRLSRRSGSHVAIRAGLDVCQGNCTICMAADGQDDPEAIIMMIKEWQKGHDIVWALRTRREGEFFLSKLCARVFYTLLVSFGASNTSVDLSRADFYLLDKKVVKAIQRCHERNTSLFGLIAWLGFNQSWVEYERGKRTVGKSKWNFSSRILLAKDWIIAFSGIPLKLMTWVGFLVALLGFSYAAVIVGMHIFFGNPVQGWSSVMTITLLLGGGMMMMLGVVGEYLWRTLDESRNRPLYFIEKRSEKESIIQKENRL